MKFFGPLFHRALAPTATAVLGVSAVAVIWLVPAVEEARLTASRLALERANAVRVELVHTFERSQADLASAAALITLPGAAPEAVLTRVLSSNESFISIALVGATGLEELRLTAEDQIEYAIGPRAHFLEPYFKDALGNKRIFAPVTYSAEGRPVVPIVEPVVGASGRVERLIVADMSLAGIGGGTPLRLGEGSVFITDNKGSIIAHPDAHVVEERRSMLYVPSVSKVVMAGEEAVTGLAKDDGYITEEGVSMFLVGVPARDGWGVFVEEPRRSALAAERKVILLSVAFCILGLLFFWSMYRRQHELVRINERFNLLLGENQQSAKLLIKKDRELRETNDALERSNDDLSETARILIRRDVELSEANSRLEELDTVKSEFVSVAAHQLRTPLTGVRWSLKALAGGEYGSLTDGQQKVANDALAAIVGAIELINDMLNVARIEGGRFNFAFANQQLAPLYLRSADKARVAASAKGIRLALDPMPDSVYAFCDAEKFVIALGNVIDNAVKYTPDGGSVEVRHAIVNGIVSIAVKDSGIGIPDSEKHRLFTKFFRAPNAVLKQTSGTGLGLYLVKNIIERHKGTISVESKEGAGTTITLTMPVTVATEPLM